MFGEKQNKTSVPSIQAKQQGQSFFPSPTAKMGAPNLATRQIPQGAISRKDFDAYVKTYFRVGDIHTGTQDEQENLFKPKQSLPGWQSWDPGTSSELYSGIIKGIEDMAEKITSMPPIDTIIFFEKDYDPGPNNVGIPQPDVGASYQDRRIHIFRHVVEDRAFPVARSDKSGKYPPVGAAVSSPGSGTGAPGMYVVGKGLKENIVHEMGHGIEDAARDADPDALVNFMAAVGWVFINQRPVLFDIQQQEVLDAIKNHVDPPDKHRIDPMTWNDPKWMEQPMSFYSVDSGPSDDFAETIVAFVYTPTVLSQRSPARYKYISDNIISWSMKMRYLPPIEPPKPMGDFPGSEEMKHMG